MKTINLISDISNYPKSAISGIVKGVLKNKLSRKLLEPQVDKYLFANILKHNPKGLPKSIQMFKYHAIHAMYTSYFRNYDKKYISSPVTNKLIKAFLENVLLENKEILELKETFQNKYGQLPPKFIVISPTKKCNLSCTGCYASSTSTDSKFLNWMLLNKIIEDAYSNMAIRFFVISGGEPLLYKSEGKTILDLANKWNDCFFLMYTNGTLINKEVAIQLASCGNLTPAISIEGREEDTDKRRGRGVYQRIVNAKNNLIKNGVPFGMSVTATKENVHLLLNKNFYNYYFDEFGATYMWMFQYMPIGREFSTELMITPEQRVELFRTQKKMLIEKQQFIADFWNSGILSDGCISCGKPGGYLYINWDGNIMPCVFIPHYIDNIKTLYDDNKTLTDALFSSFFTEGRKWQSDYLGSNDKPGNLLMPCFYRDHHKVFAEIAKNTQAKSENPAAEEALNSKEYHDAMSTFDDRLEELSSPVWKEFCEN